MKTNTLKSFLTITLAMFIISVAIYFFLIPSEVITGSVTGLAMVLAKITSLSISTLTFVINALLLILGIVLIGKEFGAKTIYASLLLPLFLAVFEKIYPNNVSLTQNAVFDMATYTLILAFGQTILFRVNASSGGTDIIAKIVNKYTHMDLGKACTLVGLLICTTSLIVYDIGSLVVGALATLSISYYDLGAKAAEMAYDILVNGKNPAEMPIEYLTDGLVPKYNADIAEALGITIPEGMEPVA